MRSCVEFYIVSSSKHFILDFQIRDIQPVLEMSRVRRYRDGVWQPTLTRFSGLGVQHAWDAKAWAEASELCFKKANQLHTLKRL